MKTNARRRPASIAAPAPVLAPARGFGSAGTAPAHAAHDFGRMAVGPLAGSGPIQRMLRAGSADSGDEADEPRRTTLSDEFAALGLPDTRRPRAGGGIMGMRMDAQEPDTNFRNLSFAARLAREQRGSFYPGALEEMGMGPQAVAARIAPRSGRHRAVFQAATGHASAARHAAATGTAMPDVTYEIGHLAPYGQVGARTEVGHNLATLAHGGNTEMMPFDAATAGIRGVQIHTSAYVRPGTQAAEYYHQSFLQDGETVHSRIIEAHRPRASRGEMQSIGADAAALRAGMLDRAARVEPSPAHIPLSALAAAAEPLHRMDDEP